MRERPFELYVFDWDGTCMDTTPFIAGAIQEAARAMGLPVPPYEVAEGVIGLGHADMMRIAVPACPESDYGRFDQEYWKAYIKGEERLSGIRPGMQRLLERMKAAGLWSAVATGKSRRGLERVMGKTGTKPLFVSTATADEHASKPAPDMLLALSEELCVPLSRMVMVGDAVHDLDMARNAGVAGVAVLWGAGKRPELEARRPLAVVSDERELARSLGLEDLL